MSSAPVLQRAILFCGQPSTLACDGRCDKAWGICGRPRKQLSDELDDYVYESDEVLGTAPPPGETVGHSEGFQLKPSAIALGPGSDHLLNKWCARECERSALVDAGKPVVLPDLAHPTPNMPWRHKEGAS